MITIAATSRFHYEKLALQLERFDLLDCWLTSLPKSKIHSIQKSKINSFPLPLYLHLGASKFLSSSFNAKSFVEDKANYIFDQYACSVAKKASSSVLIGLSHNICLAGLTAKQNKKAFLCDVPIAHPEYLNRILHEEYNRLKIPFKPISAYQINREKIAHHESDAIIAPSEFVKKTLVNSDVDKNKIHVISYGSSNVFDSINKNNSLPSLDLKNSFNILFVGQVTPRKGIHYLLQAFNAFRHPNKHLIIAGPISSSSKNLLNQYNLDNVTVTGVCSKKKLDHLYSNSHVFVLPSLAEGLALVIGEALAYGLPVIFTENTGAKSIISNNIEGFEVKLRSSTDIANALESLASDIELLDSMRLNALAKSRSLGSWNDYGDKIVSLVSQFL